MRASSEGNHPGRSLPPRSPYPKRTRLAINTAPVSGGTGLVDPRIAVSSRNSHIPGRTGLVDAGVTMNISGGTGLVDAAVAGVRHRGNIESRGAHDERDEPGSKKTAHCSFLSA